MSITRGCTKSECMIFSRKTFFFYMLSELLHRGSSTSGNSHEHVRVLRCTRASMPVPEVDFIFNKYEGTIDWTSTHIIHIYNEWYETSLNNKNITCDYYSLKSNNGLRRCFQWHKSRSGRKVFAIFKRKIIRITL